jgi:hypothetical protein
MIAVAVPTPAPPLTCTDTPTIKTYSCRISPIVFIAALLALTSSGILLST